jgi:hypothetical protein
MKQTNFFLIQRLLNGPHSLWVDITTLGDTLDEVRDEMNEFQKHNPNIAFRIINRITTIEDIVVDWS